MKFKVGDKVKLNKNIRMFKYNRAGVSYDEIGEIIRVFDDKELRVRFPSHNNWCGLEQELELVNKDKTFFKKLPNNYTGTIEVENGFIQEKEILDEEEKEYLSAVIRPFRDKVISISKEDYYDRNCYINIELKKQNIDLPYFKISAMYKGMVADKKYTLKELGLDV